MILAFVTIGWMFFGFLSYGLSLAAFTKQFPSVNNVLPCVIISAFGGPLALITLPLVIELAGFRLLPLSKAERLSR